jgi:hypothetical protein
MDAMQSPQMRSTQDEKTTSNDSAVRSSHDSIKHNKGAHLPTIQRNHKGPISAAGELQSPEEVAMGKRVNRRLDIFLLPLLSLLYLFNGLDRSNVGNAETQGKKLMSFSLSPLNCVVLLMRIVHG